MTLINKRIDYIMKLTKHYILSINIKHKTLSIKRIDYNINFIKHYMQIYISEKKYFVHHKKNPVGKKSSLAT